MAAGSVGYEFLRERLGLSAFEVTRPAVVKPVTRVQPEAQFLAIPSYVAPASDDPLDHLLFALKHEGTNLQVIAQVLPHLPAERLLDSLRAAPTGGYIRTVCSLWEALTGGRLDVTVDAGATVDLFDPERYVVGPPTRDARWRVNFNGLGSLRYCATVERTPAITKAMASGLLARVREFTNGLSPEILNRTLAWAYLHETESSFAIERERPSANKAQDFVELLHEAHAGALMTEDRLVALQQAVVKNPFDRAVQYRTEQNWLRGPLSGASGITYIPPPPTMVAELMEELVAFANRAPQAIDPIVAASVASFGFVYIHPFMDGNGRLSRYLFHQALCQSGELEKGFLLPVSSAMARNQSAYLQTLRGYSAPARQRWDVQMFDHENYAMSFNGDPSIYRFWDATACVEFGFEMAQSALDVDLRGETVFLAQYDAVIRAVNEEFDVRGNTLAVLVLSCLQNEGIVSKNRRKQFGDQVPAGFFEFLEETVRAVKQPDAENSPRL